MLIITSPGGNKCETSALRYCILASTILKCARSPPYGFPGVPSTIYAPYSGRQRDLQSKKKTFLVELE